jgi:molecular chaperone GrpE
MKNQKDNIIAEEQLGNTAGADDSAVAGTGKSREIDSGDKARGSGNGDTEATATQPAPTDPAELAALFSKAQAEKQELYDRVLRKQAEVENIRKRLQREKDEFVQHANAELVRSLLPALDGFDRALKQRDPNVPQQFYEGMELIYRQLLDALGRAGLTPIETKGATFDPHLHQAVEMVESAEHRDHEIAEELQRGYNMKQRLLRPAIVKVAVAPK